ncbi:hypothetical protein [Niallia sp. MER TA 168]|uniref:hypothetical protein n=1 Tax=Niallia sp. MER TA 168 TaxID=2939568 RepID=UPI00203D949D|nr:hypothetical protein [Niallia sp. MER TA 168]MCM3362245.1 hypothetical protein [Niallia sp. MER TA 168]
MKRIKVNKKSGKDSRPFNEWLEYFILTQLIKQLEISNYSKKLILYRTINAKGGFNNNDKNSREDI